MRILVLGGTIFLSRAVATAALAAGHDVTCVSRGVSGSAPAGARVLRADRSVPGELAAALAGESFDAVVDVATMSAPWVADALDAVGDRAGHWTFVSSINAYADLSERGGTARSATLPPLLEEPDRARQHTDPDLYGAAKTGSEQLVRERLGEKALVVRGGLMVGPGDLSDRFGYWAARFSRGGRAVVPDVPEQPIQVVDVRDLAGWIVRCAESGTTGTFDGTGPRSTLDRILREVAAAVGTPDLELVRVPVPVLQAAGVSIWSGPRSLPLWLPEELWGMADRDVTATLDAGLQARPLGETADAALDRERELGLDRTRTAGLSSTDEEAVLRAHAG
ncbi:NAD-dependent epimerase/dehydratase family protein [Pseudonocardia sp. HH130630-07]|uniref:NAD-dependent epimerase/dehydratase family protein n=1 Tax=Pseudonocardia sp. HH130630-07 TaxID=1690815 RepID=UPI000814CC72|nr:NAD-dependent epimerase/dehydratase family protein [Pseudonocardia sp. HH130630-07]ANY06424.1 epimerase [Pseudonocardia sp. HH130630-07]